MTKFRSIFAAGFLLRIILPWFNHGFRYMDEHWQVMEPANHIVHGAWSRTVEWDEGLRSWIYPALVSVPMRLAEVLGFHDPLWIASFVRMTHGALSSIAIPISYFAVKKMSAQKEGEKAALAAAAIIALWPFAVYCGIHTHGEMVAALFVLAGLAVPVILPFAETTTFILAGFCFGLALMIKIDVAVAGLGFGLWQLFRGRFRRAVSLALGALPLIILVGYVDQLTWGHWFNSVTGHARVNLVEGIGNQWGVLPWYYHFIYFFDITSAFSLLATLVLPIVWRKTPDHLRAVWFTNLFFVAVYCTIPHKEKRFMAPVLYSGFVGAFATLTYLDFKKRWIKTTITVCSVLFVVHFAANIITYWVQRPWWDRISAMREAGRIPGIQKMLSPQWPAVFYLPRNVASEPVGADSRSLEKATVGLKDIGVATDWKDLSVFAGIGFHCEAWPGPAPKSPDPVPWQFHCTRP